MICSKISESHYKIKESPVTCQKDCQTTSEDKKVFTNTTDKYCLASCPYDPQITKGMRYFNNTCLTSESQCKETVFDFMTDSDKACTEVCSNKQVLSTHECLKDSEIVDDSLCKSKTFISYTLINGSLDNTHYICD